MSPGDALDAVDEEDVVRVQNEIVNKSRGVAHLLGVSDLAW
jgi:hypothetical protein